MVVSVWVGNECCFLGCCRVLMRKSGVYSIFIKDLGLKANKVLIKFVIMIWRCFLHLGGQRNDIDGPGREAS